MKREQGYTLVELMIALAITGVMVVTIGMVIHETITVPESGNEQVSALHAIQNAAHWVSIDGQAAKAASGGSGLTLTMPDDSTVSYTLAGDELHRIDNDTDRTISTGIKNVNFSVSGRLITMTITAEQDGRGDISENGTYQIFMRPTL
jgi:prepilin-type N-terminal cleavage/methylation domain-containing protein